MKKKAIFRENKPMVRNGLGSNRLFFLLVLGGVALGLRACGPDKGPGRVLEQARSRWEGAFPQKNNRKADDAVTDVRREADLPADFRLDGYLPAYSPADQVVRHPAFTLVYVEAYEEAAWVVHHLPQNWKGNADRAENFFPDPQVATGSAVPSDYSRSGYDRGHMAPAADFSYNQTYKYDSFYMSNVSPQNRQLNAGLWGEMEIQIRKWASRRGDFIIVTGPVLEPGLPTIGKYNRVAVPRFFYKIVFDIARRQAIAFLMPNQAIADGTLQEYATTIDAIERRTGLNFFARFPQEEQQQLEARLDTEAWFGSGPPRTYHFSMEARQQPVQ